MIGDTNGITRKYNYKGYCHNIFVKQLPYNLHEPSRDMFVNLSELAYNIQQSFHSMVMMIVNLCALVYPTQSTHYIGNVKCYTILFKASIS